VKIAILNNAYLGMVRQWQELFYEERYSEVYLSPDLPDYVKCGGGDGLRRYARSTRPTTSVATIEKANEIDDRPVVIDFRTDWAREGVPDGCRRFFERRHHPRPGVRGGWTMTLGPSPHHILTVTVENNRCALPRRGDSSRGARSISSRSRSVRPDDERFSRMTIVVDAESAPLEQVVKQLNKLIPVIKITEVSPAEGVERELMLVIVKAAAETRGQVTELTAIFEAKIVDVGYDAMTIMVVGEPEKLDAFSDLVKPFGIVELQRTGRIALPKLARNPPGCVRSRPPEPDFRFRGSLTTLCRSLASSLPTRGDL